MQLLAILGNRDEAIKVAEKALSLVEVGQVAIISWPRLLKARVSLVFQSKVF